MCQLQQCARDMPDQGLAEGDTVAVVDDAHVFSFREDVDQWVASGRRRRDWPGAWQIVQVPGMTVRAGRRAMQPHTRAAVNGDEHFRAPDQPDRIVKLSERRWHFNKAMLTDLERAALAAAKRVRLPAHTRARMNQVFEDRSALADDFDTDTPREPSPPAHADIDIRAAVILGIGMLGAAQAVSYVWGPPYNTLGMYG